MSKILGIIAINVDAALPAKVYWVGYVHASAMLVRAKLTGKPVEVNWELQLFRAKKDSNLDVFKPMAINIYYILRVYDLHLKNSLVTTLLNFMRININHKNL